LLVNVDAFENDPAALMLGMLCALMASSVWFILEEGVDG
jgi:phosphate/sulfate permease